LDIGFGELSGAPAPVANRLAQCARVNGYFLGSGT